MKDHPGEGGMCPGPQGRSQGGFSLIEVTLAMGLLATVLISIASLFILGGKQVKDGKSMTAAAAITHEIMEKIEQKHYTETYTYFGGTDASTSLSVSTTTIGNIATQWQAEIEEKLGPQASGTITVTPLGTASPLTMLTSEALQVNVTITWSELGRSRNVSLQAVRF